MRRWESWGAVFRHYLNKGEDHGSAAYRADKWERHVIRKPQGVILSEDEVETVKALINDWGWDYKLTANREKVVALCRKLGLQSLAKDLEIT